MPTTVDWENKIISVLRADMLLVQSVPTEIRELDLDAFRLDLKALEAGEHGMSFLDTHSHNPPVTVGGVTLARVIEIINGYTVTFEDGQYAVNLVGANSNVADVTNVNQVSVRSANSAGLTYSKEVEDQSFTDSRVYIDTVNGLSGTQFPRGTPGDPVDNLIDAESIVTNRNLPKRLSIIGSVTVGASDSIADYDIVGASSKLSSLSVTTGGDTTNTVLEKLELTGDLNGNITARDSTSLSNIDDFDGELSRCGLSGTVTLGSGGDTHIMVDCYSEVGGTSTPVLDCSSLSSLDVSIRRYSGGIEVRNFDQVGNSMSIDLTAGNVVLDSTCTDGTIVVRGTGTLTDNSGASCTVVNTGLIEGFKIQEAWQVLGLDSDNNLEVTDTSIDVDNINITISDDGTTTTTTRT